MTRGGRCRGDATPDAARMNDHAASSYPVVEDLLMFPPRPRTIPAHRLGTLARLVVLVPLLLTLPAACGAGTGGVPAY